jgi:hypothetical protein
MCNTRHYTIKESAYIMHWNNLNVLSSVNFRSGKNNAQKDSVFYLGAADSFEMFLKSLPEYTTLHIHNFPQDKFRCIVGSLHHVTLSRPSNRN